MPRLPAPPASPSNVLGFALTVSLLSLTTNFPLSPPHRQVAITTLQVSTAGLALPASREPWLCCSERCCPPGLSPPFPTPSLPVDPWRWLWPPTQGSLRFGAVPPCGLSQLPAPAHSSSVARAARKPVFVVVGGEGKEREKCFNKLDFSANEMAAALSSEVSWDLH